MDETIIIVDDEKHIINTCQRLLMDEPYHCETFSSPEKALERARKIKPAVVISDYEMPGMNGTAFLEEIRKELPWTVRLLMTGYADVNIAISAINNGHVFKFIKKPWDNVTLKTDIGHALDYYDITRKIYGLVTGEEALEFIYHERLKGVLEMAGAVCHEFSQPLQILYGYCDLLIDMPADRDNVDVLNRYAHKIHFAAKRLGTLLQKIRYIDRYKTLTYMEGLEIIDIDRASVLSPIHQTSIPPIEPADRIESRHGDGHDNRRT